MGIVIYVLRVKKGYRSLPEAINARYGPLATVAFGEACCLPLFPGFLGRSYYQPLSCETQHAFSKALPFAARPPPTSVDDPAFSTHVMSRLHVSAAGLAVLFRLYQEIWSNAVVVAPWYGTLVSFRPSLIHSQRRQT